MPYLKYILNYGVEKGRFTQEKLDNFKEENIKKCGPGGEVKFGRTVYNPEICKAEVEDEIRENDDNDFADTYTEPCCFIEPDWVPERGAKCTRWPVRNWNPNPKAYYKNHRATHKDLCYDDAWMFWKTFTINQSGINEHPSDKVSLKNVGGRDKRRVDRDSSSDGTKFLSYWSDRENKVRREYQWTWNKECFEDGTMTDSDYNWKDFTDHKTIYQSR